MVQTERPMSIRTTLFALLLTTLAVAGCDEVDEKVDCAMICDRYRDCFDASYDTEACRGRCETNADTVADFDDKADACENCLDDRSCTGSFACVAECSGIVP